MTAFEEGVRARLRGEMREYNPYSWTATKEKKDWDDGWLEADKGDDCENGRGGDEE